MRQVDRRWEGARIRFGLSLPSQVAWGVHVLVENADDRDAVIFHAKIDGVPVDDSAPVPRPDVTAILRQVRRLRQSCAGLFDNGRIGHGLLQTPLPDGVVEDFVEIPLCGGCQAILGCSPVNHRAARACGG